MSGVGILSGVYAWSDLELPEPRFPGNVVLDVDLAQPADTQSFLDETGNHTVQAVDVSFDGNKAILSSGAYLQVPDSSSLNFGTGDFGIGIVFRTSQVSGRPELMEKQDGTSLYQLWYDAGGSNRLEFGVGNNRAGKSDAITLVGDDALHFVYGQRVGTNLELWLDGELVATGTDAGTDVSSTVPLLLFKGNNGSLTGEGYRAIALDGSLNHHECRLLYEVMRRKLIPHGGDLPSRVLSSPVPQLSIYVISDTHIKDSVEDNPDDPNATRGNDYLYTARAKVEQFVSAVNRDKPDLALHNGDVVHDEPDFSTFKTLWDQVAVPTAIVIGNHDFDASTYNDVVLGLGVTTPETAGSHFNQSLVLRNGSLKARIICVDSTIQADGEHVNSVTGHLHNDTLAWLESELAAAKEKYVLVFIHHGPPYNAGGDLYRYLDKESGDALHALLTSAADTNPDIRYSVFYGHNHRAQWAEFKGFDPARDWGSVRLFNLPASVWLETGYATKIVLTPNEMILSNIALPYGA